MRRQGVSSIQSELHKSVRFKSHNIYQYQTGATQSDVPIMWYIPRIEASPPIIKEIIEATSAQAAYDADLSYAVYQVKNQKSLVRVKNNEINPLILHMYWCEWRDTQYASTTDAARDELRETIMWNLVQGWNAKTSAAAQLQFSDAADPDQWQSNDTTFHTANPFLTPFDSRYFCRIAKIKKVKKVRLAPQQELGFKLSAPMVEWFDPNSDTGYKLGYNKKTRFLLCMQHGDLGITPGNKAAYTISESLWEFKRTANVNLKFDSYDKSMITVSVNTAGATTVDNAGFPAAATAVSGPTEMVMDDA